MSTPEGKIKRRVSAALKKHGHYWYMPVPTGFGKKGLDYFACIYGKFLAIETKAPGKKLTSLQQTCKSEIEDAGGIVFVVDSRETVKQFERYLELLAEARWRFYE